MDDINSKFLISLKLLAPTRMRIQKDEMMNKRDASCILKNLLLIPLCVDCVPFLWSFHFSGLDSQTCFQTISLLSALAAAGRTVICTIHQPSMRLLEMFQHLHVMANGRCIYRGSVPNMVPYLSSEGFICPPYHNPADFGENFICLRDTSLASNKDPLR